MNEWIPSTLPLDRLPHTKEHLESRVERGVNISESWKGDGHSVPQILRRTQEAKRLKGKYSDLDLNHGSRAGVLRAP